MRLGYTPLPLWVVRMWDIAEHFASVSGRSDPTASIECVFSGETYLAEIVPHRAGQQYRLFLAEELRSSLARTFLMSYMRELEVRLAGIDVPSARRTREHNSERAFWEFVDLEFDVTRRRMRIVAHYVQRPHFPHLFARLAGSPPMRRVEDELRGKDEHRIHKLPWRPRSDFPAEIGARNVVYMLADCSHGLLYVGEAEDMVARFRRGHPSIPEWTHFRYDLLPTGLAPHRLAIERMVICDVDALIGSRSLDLPIAPGGFRLTNSKIDR